MATGTTPSPFPTIPAHPVAPLALKLVPGREGGSEGAREVHCCWRGRSLELLYLAGARGREDGWGSGWDVGVQAVSQDRAQRGGASDQITDVSGDTSEENTRPRAAQRPSCHMQNRKKI